MQLEELIRRALSGYKEHGPADDAHDKSTGPSRSEGSSESEDGVGGVSIDLLSGRVTAAVQGLVDAGLIELVTEAGASADGDARDRRYRRVPPVPDVTVCDGWARPGGSRRRWKKGEKLSTLVDPGILKREEVEGRDRSALQEEFDAFFRGWCLSGIRVTRRMGRVVTDGMKSWACPFPKWKLPQRSGRNVLSTDRSLSV